MSYHLVLSRRDEFSFADLHGESILKRFEGPILLFADKETVHHFTNLPNCTVEAVRWADKEGVFALAERYHREAGITSIATLDEPTIEFAAQLREKLGVPGLRYEDAMLYRDKVRMKECLGPKGIRVPQFVCCSDRAAVADLLARYGKLVVKPRDGLGSKKVSFISNAAELERWYATERAADSFEAEEYIEGILYHTNSIVQNGEVLFTAIAPYLPGMGNIDFSSGAPMVCRMLVQGELHDRLKAFSEQVIAGFGLQNGVTHLEAFVSDRDEIVFVEMAIRPGGGGIVHMIEAQFGINLSHAALAIEQGRAQEALGRFRAIDQLAGLIGFRGNDTVRIADIPGKDAFAEDWIQLARIYAKPGDVKAPSFHCTDYRGLMIFTAADETQFDQRLNQLTETFETRIVCEPL